MVNKPYMHVNNKNLKNEEIYKEQWGFNSNECIFMFSITHFLIEIARVVASQEKD